MSVSNTSRRRALLFASLLISALVLTNCGKVPIDVVVMKELCDENGFDADLGYHADTDLIIAHVQTTVKLLANNAVQKTYENDYWEWFKTANLPANPQGPGSDKVKAFAGKPMFLTDVLRAGPKPVGTADPAFRIEVTRTHRAVHRAVNWMAPRRATLATSEPRHPQVRRRRPRLLVQDDHRRPPAKVDDQSAALSAKWKAQGKIKKTGDDAAKLTLEAKSTWGLNPDKTTYNVETWTYSRDFNGAKLSSHGSKIKTTEGDAAATCMDMP